MQLEKQPEIQSKKESPFKVGTVSTEKRSTIFDIEYTKILGDCACACDCASCFPAGTLVTMADGSTKKIEEVMPGDLVRGAFGEINKVLALDITTLGSRYLFRINDEHSTTSEHPHVGADRKFFVGNKEAIASEWSDSKTYNVVTQSGMEQWINRGINLDRINQLDVGVKLQTINGPKTVDVIEAYTMPPETKLYNLVMGGSHTYFVDGYAVTGWPREDDFNFDSWTSKNKSLTSDDYRATITI
jgi:hypothetical protein